MKQGKYPYYAEVMFYPALIGGTLLMQISRNGSSAATFFLTLLFGAVLWTLVEYVLHRAVLHRLSMLLRLHAMHHSRPSAYIGTPLWVSFLSFLCLFMGLWWMSGFEISTGLSCGLIFGYVCYLVIHDAVHRWPLSERSWLQKVKRRHLLHHKCSDRNGNFGVTTSFWDGVFGTKIAEK